MQLDLSKCVTYLNFIYMLQAIWLYVDYLPYLLVDTSTLPCDNNLMCFFLQGISVLVPYYVDVHIFCRFFFQIYSNLHKLYGTSTANKIEISTKNTFCDFLFVWN